MNSEQKTRTVAIKPCRACTSGLLESDKFCRRCGAPQRYTTSRLYHPVSGPLVEAMVGAAPRRSSAWPSRSITRRIILPFVSVPIWMIIVLLSPLDAYASAKALTGRL